jgi:hypothetical protein
MTEQPKWRFKYVFEQFHPDGSLKWRETITNLVPTEGLNHLLDTYFAGSFYVGLIDDDNFSAIAATDTAAKIVTAAPGGGDNQWKEFTNYTEGTRPAYTVAAAAGATVTNVAAKASFTPGADFVMHGAFIVTNSTKGGTSGAIFSIGALPSSVGVTSGQPLFVTISVHPTSV